MTATAPDATPLWPDVDDVPADARFYLDVRGTLSSSLKPALDLIAAACLLPPMLPFIALAWLLTKLGSRGPGFYVQTRSGLNGEPYPIIKIRSMKSDLHTARNLNWAGKNDDRVTAVGKLLRALHLDELPQVFNVLRGEMSLVGPRPERPEVIAGKNLAATVPGYALRMLARPGVTGLAQVQLPADSDLLSVRHKVYYDLYYLAHQSLWLDIRICAATLLKAVLSPAALRRVLFLPTRETVCRHFLGLLSPPEAETNAAAAAVPVA